MAGIFIEGDPRGIGVSELKIEFSDKPAFRLNHGILTPGVVGKVSLGYNEFRNAYFPCRQADVPLLGNTYVVFDRLAQYGSELYVDVRDADKFWPGVHPKFRPTINSKTYMLPPQGQDKDGAAQYRYLMVEALKRASYDLIDDFGYAQSEQEDLEVNSPDVEMPEHPGPLALSLAQSLKEVVFSNLGDMYENRPEIQRQLEFLGSLGSLLSHLENMSPAAQRRALNLPPQDAWKEIALDRQARSRRFTSENYDNGMQSTGG